MVQRRTKRVDRAFFLLFSLFWKVLTERLGFRSRSESMNFGVSISHIATNTEDYVGRPMRRRRSGNRGSDLRLANLGSTFNWTSHCERSVNALSSNWNA